MAERIGFITFTAFDLRAANDFEGIRKRSNDTFEIKTLLPPWRQVSTTGLELPERPTPQDLQPLMNEYHRYYHEKAVEHELYMRWWRRDRNDRIAERIAFARFDAMHDYLVDRWHQKTYEARGRMHEIMARAATRAWERDELREHQIKAEWQREWLLNKSWKSKIEHHRTTTEHVFTKPVHKDAMAGALPKLGVDPYEVGPGRHQTSRFLEASAFAQYRDTQLGLMQSMQRTGTYEAPLPGKVDRMEAAVMIAEFNAKKAGT